MEYLFHTIGNQVRLYRWSVTYTETTYKRNPETRKIETTEEAVTEWFDDELRASAVASEKSGKLNVLDASDIEWMDGIIVPDSTNPMAEAVKIYEMGREAYEAQQNAPTTEERMAQMEADIAYLAMLTDTDMEV